MLRDRVQRPGDFHVIVAVHLDPLYIVAIVRIRHHQPTRDYVQRRTAEGLSKREIIRCLKRYIAREISTTTFHARQPSPHRYQPFPQRLDKQRSIERFQQTLKKWLRAQPQQPSTIAELQALCDEFLTYVLRHHMCVREGGFEPGATHARHACIGQFEREMSSR
jgi:hypothetical protein